MGLGTFEINPFGDPVGDDLIQAFERGEGEQHRDYMWIETLVGFAPKVLPVAAIKRYQRVSAQELRIIAVPSADDFFEKLIWPVRSAKKAFVLSEYLSCIELCCHLGEMLTILTFQTHQNAKNNEISLTLDEFEKLSHTDRVATLQKFNAISSENASLIKGVRKVRSGYFHKWQRRHKKVTDREALFKAYENDAFFCYRGVVRVFLDILQIHFPQPGVLGLEPKLTEYLISRGIISSEEFK